jgi:hypothetical protein
MASLSLLHHKKQEELKNIMDNYVPAIHEYGLRVKDGHFPTSIYLKRINDRD